MGNTFERKRQFNDLINNNSIVSLLQPNLDFNSIIVLAEGWPSWVYAIAGLFGNTSIFLASKFSHIRKYCHHLFDIDVCWWSWSAWKANAEERASMGKILFCIQGSPSFGDESLLTILALNNVRFKSCIFALDFMEKVDVPGQSMFRYLNNDKYLSPSIAKLGYTSRTVSHAQCGGVTKDKRRIVAIKDNNDLISRANTSSKEWNNVGSSLRRTIFHILDTSQKGSTRPPKKLESPIFDKDSIVPLAFMKSCWLNVPSVFTKNKVYRHPSMKEILNMKDLPADMMKQMNRKNISSEVLDLIIQAAPSKLLWESARFYFPGSVPSITSTTSTSTSESSKRLKQSIDTHQFTSFKELMQHDLSISDEKEETEMTKSGVPMKAVKADDAEAEDKLWNMLLFKRCLAQDYNHEVHAPMLDTIRNKGIMTWYYRSIYKSFMKYLKSQYGVDLVTSYLYRRSSLYNSKRKHCRDTIKELDKDIRAGRDILFRCCQSNFWEWTGGS